MDPEKTLTFCLGLKAEEVTQFSLDPSILQHGNTLCVVVIVVVDKQLPQQRCHLRSVLSYGSDFSGVASFLFFLIFLCTTATRPCVCGGFGAALGGKYPTL